MDKEQHFRALEQMYNEGAPINQLILHRVTVSEGKAQVRWEVDGRFFHAAASLHGSLYFKMLDDAAFFAANSIEREVFVLTATLNVQFFKPVVGGVLVSEGWVTVPGRTLIHAHSELRDEKGRLVAAGQGTFARSAVRLRDISGYSGSEK
jgi:uncharacterized protein (TIGR00369 family)